MLKIRKETPLDLEAIIRVNNYAFNKYEDCQQIEALRKNQEFKEDLSLVADDDKSIIGYILLLPTYITNDYRRHSTLLLASIAVLPERQKQGVGTALVKGAIRQGEKMGFGSILQLGCPDYYLRFGFKKASRWNIYAPIKAQDEAILALELNRYGLNQVSGVLSIPEEFNTLT
jgi:predicted N-acetyltransferase YhbS